MRAAARVAPRRHAIDAQLSADRAYIGGAVGDGAAWLGRGLPVAWPVVPDKPQPALGGIPHIRAIKRGVPGARRAVVAPDRSSQCVTPCLKGSHGEAVHEAVKSIQASLEGGPKQTTRTRPRPAEPNHRLASQSER